MDGFIRTRMQSIDASTFTVAAKESPSLAMRATDRLFWMFLIGGTFAACATVAPSHAVTATNINSFDGREEPMVLVHPSSGSFTDDGFVNITENEDGVFRFILRYQPNEDWWDGDRKTKNRDRQRAEVKGLGYHQKLNETFRYSFDWRTDPNYVGTDSFCHVFQLKSTDGDSGAPLVTVSLGSNGSGSVRIWSGTAKSSSKACSFKWKPNTWCHTELEITTSVGNTGSVNAAFDGKEHGGITGEPVFRPNGTDYRPKWGLYRGINRALFVGTNWIEIRAVKVERVGN